MNSRTLKIILALSVLAILTACSPNKETVIIYSAMMDYRMEMWQEQLNKKFPNDTIVMQSLNTGAFTSRLQMEGKDTSADLFVGLESGNTEIVMHDHPDIFADLSSYDTSKYLDDVLQFVKHPNNYHIHSRDSGCIILNTKTLADNNLPEPGSYDDLLKPEYKGFLTMPNPKTSGVGYCFFNSMVAARGMDGALAYFEKFADNAKEFTVSGSGPVKSVDRGEVAVGLGITFQAAKYVTANPDLKIKFFAEGAPYTLYTMGIIAGHDDRQIVKDVYDFIFNDLTFQDKAKIDPNAVYKEGFQPPCEVENFPTDITYASMGDLFDYEYKQQLLDNWRW